MAKTPQPDSWVIRTHDGRRASPAERRQALIAAQAHLAVIHRDLHRLPIYVASLVNAADRQPCTGLAQQIVDTLIALQAAIAAELGVAVIANDNPSRPAPPSATTAQAHLALGVTLKRSRLVLCDAVVSLGRAIGVTHPIACRAASALKQIDRLRSMLDGIVCQTFPRGVGIEKIEPTTVYYGRIAPFWFDA
jgi:hypothetical protein